MSNDNTLVIVAVAAVAVLLLRRRTVAVQGGQVAAASTPWTNRYFQSPALAYQNPTQQRQSSQANLAAGGLNVLSQLVQKWNSGGSSAASAVAAATGGDTSTLLPPDSTIFNYAPSQPDPTVTSDGGAGDLSDFWG